MVAGHDSPLIKSSKDAAECRLTYPKATKTSQFFGRRDGIVGGRNNMRFLALWHPQRGGLSMFRGVL